MQTGAGIAAGVAAGTTAGLLARDDVDVTHADIALVVLVGLFAVLTLAVLVTEWLMWK